MRESALAALGAVSFDIFVIGGGATGAGIALDAAARGLKVGLAERADFSEGTSSRSTKLIHGGVRYLELAVRKLDRSQLNLVRSALHERHTLLKIAPHLSRAFPLLTPLYRYRELPYYYTGLKIYDLIAGRHRIGASRLLSRRAALSELPGLSSDGLKGAVEYFDGQFDDSRMVISLLRSAHERGATVLNHASVKALDVSTGAVSVQDGPTGSEVRVHARVIINATGPFADAVRRMDDPGAPELLTASSGSHIVLEGSVMPSRSGMLIPRTDDGRVLFLLPWQGHTLVGTTDDPAVPEAAPDAPERDVDYLLDYVNRYMDRSFTRADVLSAWTGFRPLLKPSRDASTASITRDHYIGTSPSGLITVTGGKWTTYRLMAEDAVDLAIRQGGLSPLRPCTTSDLLLTGAEGFDPGSAASLAAEFGLDADVASHLLQAYGSGAAEVIGGRNGHTRLHPDHPYLEAEVGYARDFEFALTAEDVLDRRLRLGFLDDAARNAVLGRTRELLAA